ARRRAGPLHLDAHVHGDRAVMACTAAAACALARPPVSLVASPSRVLLARGGRATIEVRNSGAERVTGAVTRAGFGLDLGGRPRILRRAARPWVAVRPRRFALVPGASTRIAVAAVARPGWSPATTRPCCC